MIAQMYKWKLLALSIQDNNVSLRIHQQEKEKAIGNLREQWVEYLMIKKLKMEKLKEKAMKDNKFVSLTFLGNSWTLSLNVT